MHHLLIGLMNAFTWKNNTDSKGLADVVRKARKFKTSREVRVAAVDYLIEEGFADQRRFSSGPADYFVIGGRWSGELTKVRLNPLLRKSFEKAYEDELFPKIKLPEDIEKVKKLFKEYFPHFKGKFPYVRTFFPQKEFGEVDDAQMVDRLLWNRLIKRLIRESSDDPYSDGIIYLSNTDSVSRLNAKVVVGKMWAVVIDYHS